MIWPDLHQEWLTEEVQGRLEAGCSTAPLEVDDDFSNKESDRFIEVEAKWGEAQGIGNMGILVSKKSRSKGFAVVGCWVERLQLGKIMRRSAKHQQQHWRSRRLCGKRTFPLSEEEGVKKAVEALLKPRMSWNINTAIGRHWNPTSWPN